MNPTDVEDLYSVIPNDRRVTQFADYLVDNYISSDSVFPLQIGASCTSSIQHNTIPTRVNLFSQFNNNFYAPHPDISKFMDILKGI